MNSPRPPALPSFLEHAAVNGGGVGLPDMSLSDAAFMPFTLDVAPLQRFLIHLAHQVEMGQKERDALRTEVQELKIERRLEALEQGLQDLADSVQRQQAAPPPAAPLPSPPMHHEHAQDLNPEGSLGANMTSMGMGMGGWRGPNSNDGHHDGHAHGALLAEFAGLATQLKDRMTQLERKSEALWHVQENEEQLRASIERLKLEAATAREQAADTLNLARGAQHAAERLDNLQKHSLADLEKLQEKCGMLEAVATKSQEDTAEIAQNWESTTTQIWDQIRHVEASMSQRLATSETGQVSALQEVDEMKELSSDLMQRVDEAKRHMGALEGKLESFNTQVAAAISPLHSSISAVNARMAELAGTKLDILSAITDEDVAKAAARAVDHADRRSDGILKSIAGVEARMEALTGSKAERGEVVLICDMQRILDLHQAGLDARIAGIRAGIMVAVDLKADKDELAVVDARLSARLGGLEQAVLKGLKAISDKVSAALAEKLAMSAFNEFKVQVRAVLADLEDRLREWSPTALATKASAGQEGAGATTCLFCDNRVKSVRDLRALGFSNEDRVFSPEKLPTVDAWHPGAANQPGLGAHTNAKAAGQRTKREGPAHGNSVCETLPAVPGAYESTLTGGLNSGDAMMLVQLPENSPRGAAGKLSAAGRVKVDIETISGSIGQGRIPNTRNKQAPKVVAKAAKLPTLDGISGWPSDPLAVEPSAIGANITLSSSMASM